MGEAIDRFPYRDNDPVVPCGNCGRDIGQDEVFCRRCFDALQNEKNEWKDKHTICLQTYNGLLKARDILFEEKNGMEDKLQEKIDKLEEELAELKNQFEI